MFETMRRLALLVGAVVVATAITPGVTAPALAGPAGPDEALPTGVQADPPGPTGTPRTPLDQRNDGRRAVRGCPVDQDCRPPHERLRDFEVEAFPQGGSDPWIDGGDRRGGALVEADQPEAGVKKPSELRPDLPWLDDLELPDLPVTWDRRVIDYLVFYKEDARGHAIMADWLEDQGKYADMITGYLDKAGLPRDLLYVAMIESSYDPYTYSRAGASGLWQFMPDGGKIYGLDIDRWADDRNDPIRSTEAVLGYFADLFQRFGDWHLALAAYNAGYGQVIRAIARYNTNDFWQLLDYENGLPWESGIYVPKALAAAIVGHNRAAFGFAELETKSPETWDDVTVPTSVSFSVIARAAGCTVRDIERLNPQLLRKRTPPGRKYSLRVPRGGAEAFATKFGQLRGDWDGYDAYVVAHGERFEDVATMFGISRRKLLALNELDSDADAAGGTTLVVPQISVEQRKKNLAKAKESLYSSGVDQKAGEALIVPVPDKDAHVEGKRRVFYRVVNGDGLDRIARALGVKRKQLATWNGLEADAKLHPRMILQAWVAEGFDEAKKKVALLDETRILVVTRGSKEHLDIAEERTGRVRLEYTAKKKESFATIAKKYGLTDRDLARINRRPHTTVIDKGETIIVYQVVDRTRSERADKQWKAAPKDNRGKQAGKGTRPAEGTANVEAEPAPEADPKAEDAMPAEDVEDAPASSPDDVE